jgi:O-antigen/teichoic acid export membrane protein
MKKLLLIGLVAGVLAFVPAQRSDAQVYFSVGFGGPGYYGYYPYGYYYPYRYYYRPYYRGSYYRPYYGYGGHRYYYRHHRNHYYYRP